MAEQKRPTIDERLEALTLNLKLQTRNLDAMRLVLNTTMSMQQRNEQSIRELAASQQRTEHRLQELSAVVFAHERRLERLEGA